LPRRKLKRNLLNIETYGIKAALQSIHKYLGRYENLLSDYMNSLKPKFSGHANVDELFVKIDGEMNVGRLRP